MISSANCKINLTKCHSYTTDQLSATEGLYESRICQIQKTHREVSVADCKQYQKTNDSQL